MSLGRAKGSVYPSSEGHKLVEFGDSSILKIKTKKEIKEKIDRKTFMNKFPMKLNKARDRKK